jgi:hypothetical protein
VDDKDKEDGARLSPCLTPLVERNCSSFSPTLRLIVTRVQLLSTSISFLVLWSVALIVQAQVRMLDDKCRMGMIVSYLCIATGALQRKRGINR